MHYDKTILRNDAWFFVLCFLHMHRLSLFVIMVDNEVDQRGLGQRLYKTTVKHVN